MRTGRAARSPDASWLIVACAVAAGIQRRKRTPNPQGAPKAGHPLQDSQNPYSSSTELTCAPLSLQLRVGSGVKIGQRIDPAHRKNKILSSCVVFVTAKSKLCDIPYIIQINIVIDDIFNRLIITALVQRQSYISRGTTGVFFYL